VPTFHKSSINIQVVLFEVSDSKCTSYMTQHSISTSYSIVLLLPVAFGQATFSLHDNFSNFGQWMSLHIKLSSSWQLCWCSTKSYLSSCLITYRVFSYHELSIVHMFSRRPTEKVFWTWCFVLNCKHSFSEYGFQARGEGGVFNFSFSTLHCVSNFHILKSDKITCYYLKNDWCNHTNTYNYFF
jgi:hypothetical protein